MKVVVLLNESAGAAVAASGESTAERIGVAFASHGVEATVKIVAGPEIARAAATFVKLGGGASGFDGCVVAGGDGTISAAVSAFADSGLPLGILPMGTLNHFAKDLGIPLETEAAAGVIAAGLKAKGGQRRIDIAELNGHVFVNNSSVGLYPFMVKRRNADQRQLGRGKFAATLPAALRTLFDPASWHRLAIRVDGIARRRRTPCVFVGNNPYEVELATFGSRKCLDSGELCVHVLRQQTRLGILMLPFKVALGLADPTRDIEHFATPRVDILSHARHLHVSLDGEVLKLATPLHYRSRPGALSVFAPAASREAA